MGMVSFIISL